MTSLDHNDDKKPLPPRPRYVHPDATPFRPPTQLQQPDGSSKITPEQAVLGMAQGMPTMAHQHQQMLSGGGGIQRIGDSNQGMVVVPMQGTTLKQISGANAGGVPPHMTPQALELLASQGIDVKKLTAGPFSTAGVAPVSYFDGDPKHLTPHRRAEMLQRQIEFTGRLIDDTQRAGRNVRFSLATELFSFGAGVFLFAFGIRKADPTQGLLRSFATTRPAVARLGSIYCLAGMFGMGMTFFFLPMEYQAIRNADFALQQLQRTQQMNVLQRDELMRLAAAESDGGVAAAAEGKTGGSQ